MVDIAGKQVIPAVIRYVTNLAHSINEVTAAGGGDVSVQKELLDWSSDLLSDCQTALSALAEADRKAQSVPVGEQQARFYRDQVVPAMEALREPVDRLEMIVDKELWPMPSYGDLLFEV